MYRSIDYLLILLITFLSLKLIQTESHDLKINFTQSTIIEDNQSETSYEFCIPFYTCPKDLNRSILIILVPIFILICCFYYHCYEYCKVKHDLEQFQQYHHIDGSLHTQISFI